MKQSTPDEIMDAALDELRLEIEQATGCFTRHLAEQLKNVPLPPYERQALAVQYWATVMRAVMHRFAVFAGHEHPEAYAHHGSLTEVCRMTHDLQLKEMPTSNPRPQRFKVERSGTFGKRIAVYGVVFYDQPKHQFVIAFFERFGDLPVSAIPGHESPWPELQRIIRMFALKNFQWLDSDMNWPSHEEYLASRRD